MRVSSGPPLPVMAIANDKISYSIEKLNNSVNYVSSIRINIFLSVELLMFSNPLVLTCVLRVRENSLEETVLLSTHNTSHDYSLGRSYEYTQHMFWTF